MASLDKEGLYYVKEDPQLGKIRGLDPWAVENEMCIRDRDSIIP